MTSFQRSTITAVLSTRPGLTRVELDDGSRAFALTQLTGPVGAGDAVIVNTTAIDRGLGTGGWHIVHWNLDAEPMREVGPGHLMKLRYTSLQVDAGAAEEADEPADGGAAVISTEPSGERPLDAVPVVVAGLHSHLPVLAATIAEARPGCRVAYVMTDGGALPIALSDVVAELMAKDLLVGTVTAGHAFGGDYEALNVPSALVTARARLDADVIVVAMGPGVAGTSSTLGFSGLEAAPALDAAAWLGGRPIMALRCSGADPRARHRGVSHHSRTVLDAVRSEIDIAVPPEIEPLPGRHRWHRIEPGATDTLLMAAGLAVRSMGRSYDDDPVFFRAAAVAGVLAARFLDAPAP